MFKNLLKMDGSSERLEKSVGSTKYDYSENLTSFACTVQPIYDEAMIATGVVGQMAKMYCERIDIIVSDKVLVGGKEYIVKSVQDFNYGGTPHFEIILTELKQ